MKKRWHNIKLQIKLAWFAYTLTKAGLSKEDAQKLVTQVYKNRKR